GGERRRRIAADLLALDLGDGKSRRARDRIGGVARRLFVREIVTLELLAVEMRQACGEPVARGVRELDLDGPVFARVECLDLGFALADEAQRNGLDAAGGAAARQLAPQHRRQGESDEIIERAAREI